MQKKSTELIITRKQTTRTLLGIMLIILLGITLIQSDFLLGKYFSYAFVYTFGGFALPFVFILLLCAFRLFFKKKEKNNLFSLTILFLFFILIFVSVALTKGIEMGADESFIKGSFTDYKNILDSTIETDIYSKSIKNFGSLKGGMLGYILFAIFADIIKDELIVMVLFYVLAGSALIGLVLLYVKKYKKPRLKVKKEKKAKPIKYKEQPQKQNNIEKFSFGEQEEYRGIKEEEPIIREIEVEDIHSKKEKEQYADSSFESFDVFKDDLLSGKPLNPLIDNIEGGDAFDVFHDSLLSDEDDNFEPEVQDLSDTLYDNSEIVRSNLYTKQAERVIEEPKIEEIEEVPQYEDFEQQEELENVEENPQEIESYPEYGNFEGYDAQEQFESEEIYEEPVVETIEVAPQAEEVKPKEEVKVEVKKPIKINKNYTLPPLNLLENPTISDNTDNIAEANVKAVRLNGKLQSLGIKAKVKDFIVAPSFTRFQIETDPNVKINIFSSVKNDLMMALSAQMITILTPIPGTSYVGIDIPNVKRTVVTFKECLAALPFDKQHEKLLMVAGKDILDNVVSFKLNDTPHLLVAGATGGGKSAGLNGYIMSILMRCKPTEVKLVLIDPKQVEFSPYNGIPHLLCPVINDAKEASIALKKIVDEIHRRNSVFKEVAQKNIDSYNRFMRERGQEEMPYIVVIVDELANLMLVARQEVEDSIAVISSLARSAGIHLVVATQRPSVDVITGVIKANIPSRIAFAVSSYQDSRVILDDGGADQLLGKGDMLMKIAGQYSTSRVQGCFIKDEEIARVADFVRGQQEAIYNEEFLDLKPKQEQQKFDDIDATLVSRDDEQYEEVLMYLQNCEITSVSSLRRHFQFGQPKAGRFIDMLTDDGFISVPDGNKPRTVFQDRIREYFNKED